MSETYPPFIIGDGYTESAYLKAIPQVHAEVRFSYRPAPILERVEIIENSSKISNDVSREEYLAQEVAKRITRWSLTGEDDRGRPIDIEVSADNLLRLRHPRLFSRFASIVVYSSETGDVDPDIGNERNEIQRNAELAGKNVGDVRQAVHQGN